MGDSIKDQYVLLEKLDEIHQYALQNIELVQRRWKNYYDNQFLKKIFKHGNFVLLYDSQFQKYHGKLKMKWLGPFWVLEVFTNNSM